MNTAIIILAGGSSTRMSSPKQLLKFNGRSLIRGAGQIAQSLKPKRIITVTGFLNNEIQNELQDFVIEYIHNENHRRGMSSSIVCGIKAIKSDVKIDGALIMLCDQPLIPIEHYKKLIEIAHKGKAEIVASAYNNTFGAPALFKRCHRYRYRFRFSKNYR